MRPAHLTVVGRHLVVLAPGLGGEPDDAGNPPPHDLATGALLQEALPLHEQEEARPGQAATVDPRQEQAQRLATTVARTLLETLQGRRPLPQLEAWADDQPQVVTGAWQRRRRWARTQLTGVRACLVTPRVVEATALFDEEGMRFGAVLRMEHRQGRWVLADFDVLLPPVLRRPAARAG